MKTLTLSDEAFAALQALNSWLVNNVAEEDLMEALTTALPDEKGFDFGDRVAAWFELGEKLA